MSRPRVDFAFVEPTHTPWRVRGLDLGGIIAAIDPRFVDYLAAVIATHYEDGAFGARWAFWSCAQDRTDELREVLLRLAWGLSGPGGPS